MERDCGNKRHRRSSRLEIKAKHLKTKYLINGDLGYFEIIPMEVKFTVFTFLSVKELSILALASKAMRDTIEMYRECLWTQKFLLPSPLSHASISHCKQSKLAQQYLDYGLLIKRITCLYSTKDRLSLLQKILLKYMCSTNSSCTKPDSCPALFCYGRLLHSVIAGWDDKECVKTFNSLSSSVNMLRNLGGVVKSKPNSFNNIEIHTRMFMRHLFITPCKGNTDKSFWLNLILQNYAFVNQAKILFLLFGPICGDELQWYEMCESTPEGKQQATLCFQELALAIQIMHQSSRSKQPKNDLPAAPSSSLNTWTETTCVSILDELFAIPDEWLTENIAHLLYFCGDKITLKYLTSKAINKRLDELASLITSLSLVCVQQSGSLTWMMAIIKNICQVFDGAEEKTKFLYRVVDVFREVLVDLHEYGEPDDGSIEDIQNMLDANALFTKELISIIVRCNCSRSEE